MKRLICLAMLLAAAVSGPVGAAEIQVVTENLPPYSYMENGGIRGMSTEIVRATLDRAGIAADIEMYPWVRAYKMALNHPNVLIYSIVRTAERENDFKWIGPIHRKNIYFYKLKRREDVVVTSPSDALAYKTGVMHDDIAHHLLKSRGFRNGVHLEVVSREELNIRKLFGGRIDLIVQSSISLPFRMEALGYDYREMERLSPLHGEAMDICMAFGRKTPDGLVEKVRGAFLEIEREGIIDRIKAKYIHEL